MSELTVYSNVSIDDGHGAWENPIRVTEDFGDMSFIRARFWWVEKVENLSLIKYCCLIEGAIAVIVCHNETKHYLVPLLAK